MGDLLTFAPRPKPVAPPAPDLPTEAEIRARIEAAAEAAVDLAQRLIATLDAMDGCPDDEDGGDAEPSLAAPEDHESQTGWCGGGDEDREAEAGEAALPEVAVANVPVEDIRPVSAAVLIPLPLVPRGGRGSLCTAAAIHLFDLVAGEG